MTDEHGARRFIELDPDHSELDAALTVLQHLRSHRTIEELRAPDSGTQRVDAHRFYFREGFVITDFHFRRELGSA